MQIWGYCEGCKEWFLLLRGIDGVVIDWNCPVCRMQPARIEQWEGAEEWRLRTRPGQPGPTRKPKPTRI